jgi:hypothetical protein
MNIDWKRLIAAVELVAAGGAQRVDGDGWKVYRVGMLVRIDLG